MKSKLCMRNKFFSFGVIVFLLLFIIACGSSDTPPVTTYGISGVKSIEITGKAPWSSTNYSGAYGPYEVLKGTVNYEVDPNDPRNKVIVDLDKAPRNAAGLVEFSTDLQILKPVNMALGSKKLFYIVNNRGGQNKNFDDLMANRGFAIVLNGWQGNIAPGLTTPGQGQFGSNFPIAKYPDGSTITGEAFNTFYLGASSPATPQFSLPLTYDRGYEYKHLEAVSTSNAQVQLTVRANIWEPKVPIAENKWAFATANPDGTKGAPSTNAIWLKGGFQPGLWYELVYVAKDPIVNGLGFASVRDLISFLKHDPSAGNPLAVSGGIQYAYAYGKSQSGRFLRVFTYLGFNEDESYGKVFDGIFSDSPGGSQGAFNFRFCNPGRVSSPDADLFQLSDYPPFGFTETTDPYTGVTGSLLERAIARNVVPKFFQTQTAAEYWTRSGSLAHLLPDLSGDQQYPATVRYYHTSSTQHSPSTDSTTNPIRQLPSNPNNHKPVIDGLIIALDEWVSKGIEPPVNTLPRLADKTVGDWRQEASGFPKIPGVNYPAYIHEPPVFDVRTMVDGVLSQLPIKTRPPHFYPAYSPTVDADGNEIAGIRTPDIQCPIGTYTGWVLTQGEEGAGTLIRNGGSYIPFARYKADRLASGDPRLSLEERYASHNSYVTCVTNAANALASKRFILPEMVQDYINRAAARTTVP